MISLGLLRAPVIKKERINKGAIILSDVDLVVERFPKLRKYFYILERRGWEGINPGKNADIKLVEDTSVWDEIKLKFPDAILLPLAGADFVNTDKFKPINLKKDYDGIQIAAWQKFKRSEIFFNMAKILANKKFVKFGHMFYDGKDKEELEYKKKFVSFCKENCLNIDLPYGELETNDGLPNNPEIINEWINKSKFGIITSKVEGINRFKLECLSAGIPVLIPNDANTPLKKHINKKTGVFYEPTPEGLARGIEEIEKNYSSFSPREYVLKNTGMKNSMKQVKNTLKQLSLSEGGEDIYSEIEWDGRNQSLIWEAKALKIIEDLINKFEKEINNN